jgi:hypothetical protein
VKYLGGGRVQLSYIEVVSALDAAGWPKNEWAMAAAVIAAESDRCCNIYNTYKSGHYGLMQMSASAHPDWFKSLPSANAWVDPVTNCKGGLTLWRQNKYQPWEAYTNGRYSGNILQAQAAATAYEQKKKAAGNPSGMDFAPKIFRPAVIAAIGNVQMNAAVQSVTDAIAGAGKTTGDAVSAAGAAAANAAQNQAGAITGGIQLLMGAAKWMSNPESWLRVAQVVAGGALLIGGMAIVARAPVNKAVAGVAQTAAAVAPVGRAVKKAGAAVGRTGAAVGRAAKKTRTAEDEWDDQS